MSKTDSNSHFHLKIIAIFEDNSKCMETIQNTPQNALSLALLLRLSSIWTILYVDAVRECSYSGGRGWKIWGIKKGGIKDKEGDQQIFTLFSAHSLPSLKILRGASRAFTNTIFHLVFSAFFTVIPNFAARFACIY